MKKKKTNNYFLIVALLIIGTIVAFAVMGSNKTAVPSNDVQTNTASGDAQVVMLKTQGSSYVLTPSELKVGVPVKMNADMSAMPGCSRSIVIPEFGVRKVVSAGNNIIEFTPTKAGTFNIMCSMNMYRGTFTVVNADGSASNYVETKAAEPSGGSCGMKAGDGGCGCGGASV